MYIEKEAKNKCSETAVRCFFGEGLTY